MSSKIKFLIQELVSSLQVNESTEGNVEIISKNLVLTNAEFKRIPKAKFKEMVETTLTEIIKGRAQEVAASNAVVERKVPAATPKKSSSVNTSESAGSLPSSTTQKSLTSGVKRKRATTTLKDKSDLNSPDFQSAMSTALVGETRPTVRLSDLAGLESTIQTVKELVFYPVQLPTLYKQLGIQPPSGLLLHGPSGCGKTTLAMAIGGELDLPFFKVSGPELIGGTSGESETRIRELFDNAIRHAPSIIFIDAIDVIAGKREGTQRGMDRRVVAQLFDCIDDIKNLGKVSSADKESGTIISKIIKESGIPELGNEEKSIEPPPLNSDQQSPASSSTAPNEGESVTLAAKKHVIFIAATDKPDALDPGVRGRFSKELALPVPDAKARTLILKLATGQMTVDSDVDFESLGKSTPGFVGADLHALCSEAGVIAVKRIVSCFPSSDNSVALPAQIEEMIQSHHNTMKSSNSDMTATSDTKEETGSEMEVVDSSISDLAIVSDATILNNHEEEGTKTDFRDFSVTMADFLLATKNIQPSAKREGFAVVPDVTWNDVGALSSVREELLHNVIEPISHPERFIQLGLEVPAGVLFFGPPGKLSAPMRISHDITLHHTHYITSPSNQCCCCCNA
jgi:ribosome biogenesis ATPase